MKKWIFISIITLLIFPCSLFGQDSKKIDKNLENISVQYAECTAYYRLIYHASNSSNEPEIAKGYRELEDKAMFYSLILANEGRSVDMGVEVTNSRIELYMKKMKQEIQNRNENISILINRYHRECQELMENPSSQMVAILTRLTKELANEQERKL